MFTYEQEDTVNPHRTGSQTASQPASENGIFRADLESIRYPLVMKQGDYCRQNAFYFTHVCFPMQSL
jgi:hypothetical protein